MNRDRMDMFRYRPLLCVALLLVGAACTRVPELDATIPANLRDAPFPELVPLDEFFATAQLPQDQASEIEQSLDARRDRLQARARLLKAPLVDPAERKRMQGGVNR